MFKRSAQTKSNPGLVTKALTNSAWSRSPSWDENRGQGRGSQQVDGAAELTPVTTEKGVGNVGEGGWQTAQHVSVAAQGVPGPYLSPPSPP